LTTILVTGVGAIIGYGLLRSLRATGRPLRLVGADIHADAVGQAWADAFVQAPLTSSPGYLEWLESVVARHRVDLVIPGIEQDLHRYSDDRATIQRWSSRIVLNDARLIDLSRDKWLMHGELEAIGEPSVIPSFDRGVFDDLAARLGLPFLLKPRRSYASKGIVVVTDRDVFDAHAHRLGSVLIAQPIVGSPEQEYTVGVFGDGHGRACASIALRRKLAADGSTAKAWVSADRELEPVVERLCRHFRPVGPTNFQFRLASDGWKLLEINPRVSSSTSLRAAFGYNEAAMCIDYFLHGKAPSQPALRPGFAARYIEDYVVHDRDHF
jgi:carbamoyl-phosphate synthase large subunit